MDCNNKMVRKKYIKMLKAFLGRTNENNLYKVRAKYAEYYDTCLLQENLVIIESNQGKSISEKEYGILKTLYQINENKKYQLVVAVCSGKEKEIRNFLNHKKLYGVKVAVIHTKYYCKVLATAHFLVNNYAFPSYFIKRTGQIYINTGCENYVEYIEKEKIQDFTGFGNIQRNLIMADYIICHNEKYRSNLEKRFMLKTLFMGNYITMEDCSRKNNSDREADSGEQEIVQIVFERRRKEEKRVIKNEIDEKQNVLIYGGALLKNGITTALKGLLNHVDLDERNYILLVNEKDAEKNIELLQELDERLSCVLIEGKKLLTDTEAIVSYLYFKFNIENNYIFSKIKHIYKREVKRLFGSACFHAAIHFSGYEKEIVHLISEMDSRKIIFVHNNMNEERRTKSNFHVPSIKYAYTSFDYIAGVRGTMKKEIEELLERNVDEKIRIVHNLNDIETIIEKSEREIEFEEETTSTHTIEEIEKILNDQKNLKFISIGRFSAEKAHERLLEAFEQFCRKNPNSYLILIGGYGPLYQTTMDRVHKSVCQKQIVVIKSMSNPYPVLMKCNAFFLASFYEGLPMTIMEALILGVPVISVDIDGPRQFLEQGYGELVESSVEGLLLGMERVQRRELCLRDFDAYEFNKQALQEFEALLKN